MKQPLQSVTALVSDNPDIQPEDKAIITQTLHELEKKRALAEFKYERTLKVKQTLSILLEESINELEQKKKDLEAANQSLLQSFEALKATQNQLIQKEKMASLGELTAGIAHEIQNPLNFVNNFAELSAELAEELQDHLQQGEITNATELSADLRQNMDYIVQNGQRASGIVRSMLEHSRSSTGERHSTNLNQLADEYLRLAYHGIRARNPDFNVQLHTEFAPDLPALELAGQYMGRVLLNLYTNAFYAVQQKQRFAKNTVIAGLPEDGDYQPRVWVSTRLASAQPGRQAVELSVKDNGTGIPATIIDKIYQPFFTTKPADEGTGLGLSLSYDIVTRGHSGEMRVESREGEGTEFTIRLPLQLTTQPT